MADSYNELFGKGQHAPDSDLFGHWLCQETSGSEATNEIAGTTLSYVNGDFANNSVTGPGDYLANAASITKSASRHLDAVSATGTSGTTTVVLHATSTGLSGSASPCVATIGSAGTNNFQFRLEAPLDNLRVLRRTSSQVVSSGIAFTSDTWHHFAGIATSSSGQAFVDGTGDVADNVPLDWYSGVVSPVLRFGRQVNRTNQDFDGAMAGLAVFNRQLTVAEITQHRLGPEPLNVTPPSISGTPSVGETLSATGDIWDSQNNGVVTRVYQWYRADDDQGTNEIPIAGANSPSYVVQPADDGKYLRCGIRGENLGGYDLLEFVYSPYVLVAGAATEVTPDNATSATSITEPTLAVTVSVDVDDLTVAASISEPALAVTVSVDVDDLAVATSVTEPTTLLTVSVDADDLTAATSITEPALSVTVSVDADDLTAGAMISTPAVGSEAIATVDPVAVAVSISEPALAVTVSVAVDDLAVTTSVTEPVVGSEVIATVDAAAVATSITEPAITAIAGIAVEDLAVAASISEPSWSAIVTLRVDDLTTLTSISDPVVFDATIVIPGAESRVSAVRAHARVTAHKAHSRVYEEHEMGILNCVIWKAGEGAVDFGAVDYTPMLDAPEELTGTPTVVELDSSDLTISNVAINTSVIPDLLGQDVQPGHAVTFHFEGMLAGKQYRISVKPDTTLGRTWPTEQLLLCQ